MNSSKSGRLIVALLLFVVTAVVSAANASKLYWSASGNDPVLQRAGTDGTNIEDLVQALTYSVDIDPVARKLYWLQGFAPGTTLRRSNLDATGLQILDEYEGLDAGPLTVGGGSIYVARFFFEGCIGAERYNLNGALQESILPGTCIWGMEVDPVNQKLYWSQGQSIRRGELDGSNPETLVVTPDATPVQIEFDLQQGKMYWNQRFGAIMRADLDGSNVETLIENELFIHSIALDLPAGKLYWSLEFGPQIMRANLDGSNPELFLEINTRGIALDPVRNGADVPAVSPRGAIALVLVLLVVSMVLLRKQTLGP